MSNEPQDGARVAVAGGGVAGLEALLALSDLAGARAQLTLVAPEPDFVYKPLLVEEPFDLGPPERHALEPLAAEMGARFVMQPVRSVQASDHVAELGDGSILTYDFLVVCVGARFHPALGHARTFPFGRQTLRTDDLLRGAGEEGHIAFVVPPGVTWTLPIYEIALMTQRRTVQRGLHGLRLTIITPEESPLAAFGPRASEAVGELLSARGIEIEPRSHAHESEEGELLLTPGDRRVEASEVVALPGMSGPAIPGLPSDEDGFIPIDEHARVSGADDVYAAGDGTNFPIKQGGLASQQADAAASHLAHRLGAGVDPEPFHPVLRGKLLTGDESLHLRTDVAGGGGEGETSLDSLWWPPQKIGARYLASWLYHGEPHQEPEPPGRTLDVEVALPKEWHEDPIALDPYGVPRVD